MTAGIKLSNLYLRDGNNLWHSLKDAFIGDILGLDSVEDENLENFFQNLENYTDWTILELRFNDGKLSLWNKEKNQKLSEVSIGSGGSGGSSTDTNTTYEIDIQKYVENDEEVYDIILIGSDGTRTSKRLPDQWHTKFWAENGVGLFTKIREGNSASGNADYTGDNSTISISADNVISLYNKGNPGIYTATPQQLIFSTTNTPASFYAISNITVDKYGRVTGITTKQYNMPSVNDLVNNPDIENLIAQKVKDEIEQIVQITG